MSGSTKKYVVRYYEIDVPNDLKGSGVENAIKTVYNDEGDRQIVLGSTDAVAVFISDHYMADTAPLVSNYDVQVFDHDPVIEDVIQKELPFDEVVQEAGGHADQLLDYASGKFSEADFAEGERTLKFFVKLVDKLDGREEDELLK
jgi:hypothetical protein